MTNLGGNGGELNLAAEFALPLAVLENIVHEANINSDQREHSTTYVLKSQ